jgi:hypothetical protein
MNVITAMKTQKIHTIVLLAFCSLLIGCMSPEQIKAERRQRLLEMYPPGKTTREDVQKRWDMHRPDLSVVRPAAGWSECKTGWIRAFVENSERRTGKSVYRFDRYWGPDGVLSLCWCWFCFDENDRLVDAEWQYHSD